MPCFMPVLVSKVHLFLVTPFVNVFDALRTCPALRFIVDGGNGAAG